MRKRSYYDIHGMSKINRRARLILYMQKKRGYIAPRAKQPPYL